MTDHRTTIQDRGATGAKHPCIAVFGAGWRGCCVPTCAGTAPRLGRRAAAFTLTELLIAIGVMGVGLAMLAAMFVAGIADVEQASGQVTAAAVAQGGLATAKRYVNSGHVTGTSLVVLAKPGLTTVIPAADQVSPRNTSSRNGFLVLGRQVDSDSSETTPEGHQLVIIAYRRTSNTNVQVNTITASCADTVLNVTASGDRMRVGSPVICSATGEWARIVAIESSTRATLDRAIASMSTAQAAWVVWQDGSTTADLSPATAVLVHRLELKEP